MNEPSNKRLGLRGDGNLAHFHDWVSAASPYERSNWALLPENAGLDTLGQACVPESRQRDLDATFGHRTPCHG